MTRRKTSLLREIFRNRALYLMLLPTFALLFLFNYYPAVSALYHSFFRWSVAGQSHFIGLGNFRAMLDDVSLRTGVANMAKLIAFGLTVPIVIPLFVAEAIFSFKGNAAQNGYRVAFTIPMAIPGMVILLLWTFIYSPSGMLNEVLGMLGLGNLGRGWLGDPQTALYAVMAMGFPWAGGFSMLIYYSGLCAVSPSVYDSAIIDGVTWWSRFWRIDLPLLAGQLKLLLIMSVVIGVQGFEGILVLTNGGPGYATMVPGLRMYQNAFFFGKMGYSCAIGLVMFLTILLFTVVLMKYIRSDTEFE